VPPGSSLKEAIAAFQGGDLNRARTLAEANIASASDPQWFHLFGLIECRSGRVAKGMDWLRRAWEAEPDNLGYRIMLARALVDGERPQEALEIAQPPAGNTPPELALWHVRAEAADKSADWHAASEAWAKVCTVRPEDWRVWTNRANALGSLDRWPEAVEAFKRAVALNPSELPLQRAFALALGKCGRFQESADELGRWIDASPDDVLTRIMYSRMLADLGRGEESALQLDKAAQLAGATAFEESAEVLLALVSGRDGVVDVAAARELAQLLERSSRNEGLKQGLEALIPARPFQQLCQFARGGHVDDSVSAADKR